LFQTNFNNSYTKTLYKKPFCPSISLSHTRVAFITIPRISAQAVMYASVST